MFKWLTRCRAAGSLPRSVALSLLCLLPLAPSRATPDSGLLERTPVVSSDLASVGYDAKSKILEIEFHSGGLYRYFEVPKDVFDQLLAAESKGRFFAAHIREHFRFERIKRSTPAAK
jgi:hypothetical protein